MYETRYQRMSLQSYNFHWACMYRILNCATNNHLANFTLLFSYEKTLEYLGHNKLGPWIIQIQFNIIPGKAFLPIKL